MSKGEIALAVAAFAAVVATLDELMRKRVKSMKIRR